MPPIDYYPQGTGMEERLFADRLRAMHALSMELSALADPDALLRRAVAWGLERLGFDRLSVWLVDEADPEWSVGTWGTDESGAIRDERGRRVRRDPAIAPPGFYEGRVPFLLYRDEPCYDDERRVVGRGDKAMTPLWYGTEFTGELAADNLVTGRPIGERSVDLLVIFSRIVANRLGMQRSFSRLRTAYEDRDTLLRELRHRTRNTFAIIGGLVDLEAGRIGDEAARSALEAIGRRVRALGSLHELLGDAGDFARVRLDRYLGRLAGDLAEGADAAGRGIALELGLDAVELDARRATSVGIALNELVTDSLKYAFPGGRRGRLLVTLRERGDEIVLETRDDGVGLAEDFRVEDATGLGLGLVGLLAAQLGGAFERLPGPGAAFRLRFPRQAR